MTAEKWKEWIVGACKRANTYGEQYEAVIDTLSEILEKRDAAARQYEDGGGLPLVEYTNKNGVTNMVKNPALQLWDSLNHSALEHWRELGLTPSSYKKITGEGPKKEDKKSGLMGALRDLES